MLPIEVMIAIAINIVVVAFGYYAITMWGAVQQLAASPEILSRSAHNRLRQLGIPLSGRIVVYMPA